MNTVPALEDLRARCPNLAGSGCRLEMTNIDGTLCAVCDCGLVAAGAERIALALPRSPDTRASRHEIPLEAGKLHVYADQAERLIAADVYVRGLRLVRLGLAPELSAVGVKGISRNADQRVIVPVNVEWLRRTLNARAEFQRWSQTRRQFEPTNCPGELVRNILDAGDWQHFRPLEGIATAPFLRTDGTICDSPGYDAASRVFYAPNAEFPPIPVEPNADDADGAMERLLEPFSEFPFANDASRAAFAVHILAAVARHAIDKRPIVAYTAPVAATGKTILAGMASRIADGIEPAERPYSDDSEEMRKVLMAALLAGDSTLLLDNLPNGSKVRSAVLCGFATAAIYSDRKLGVSESPSLPNRCAVLLTGNNITPASDLARRTVVVRLDVQAESARGRQFKIPDLGTYVAARRPQLLVDALTVIRAFVLAGCPSTLHPLESFESWSRFARDPVAWLGYGDAVATQELETEDELAPLREAFQRLTEYPDFAPGKTFAARDIVHACGSMAGTELKAAIEASGCSDASSPVKIGYWLRENRDRVAASWKLTQGRKHAGSAQWVFRPLGAESGGS